MFGTTKAIKELCEALTALSGTVDLVIKQIDGLQISQAKLAKRIEDLEAREADKEQNHVQDR